MAKSTEIVKGKLIYTIQYDTKTGTKITCEDTDTCFTFTKTIENTMTSADTCLYKYEITPETLYEYFNAYKNGKQNKLISIRLPSVVPTDKLFEVSLSIGPLLDDQTWTHKLKLNKDESISETDLCKKRINRLKQKIIDIRVSHYTVKNEVALLEGVEKYMIWLETELEKTLASFEQKQNSLTTENEELKQKVSELENKCQTVNLELQGMIAMTSTLKQKINEMEVPEMIAINDSMKQKMSELENRLQTLNQIKSNI